MAKGGRPTAGRQETGSPVDRADPPKRVYVSFSSEINPTTTEGLLGVCADLANKRVPEVHLLISTTGGHTASGLNIYNVLRGMPFRLITHNAGSVNSIGNVVFLAGEERYAVPTATFMFHGVGFNISGNTRLEQKGLSEKLDGILADQAQIASVFLDRSNFTEEEVSQLFLEAATKDAGFALEKGLVHDIRQIEIPTGGPLVQLQFHVAKQS
jgi:ATP-dependent Clp protease protease subunit